MNEGGGQANGKILVAGIKKENMTYNQKWGMIWEM